MTSFGRTAFVLTLALTLAGAAAFAAQAQSRSPDGENRRVRVHNQTGATVRTLSAAEGTSGVFGPDLLTPAPLEPGQSRPLTIDNGAGACVFTLRAVLSDGRALDRPGVDVCRIADVYLTR